MKGRLASLLEVGTGFHPELTGRENIYLNGAILGMKKGEIERKFNEIVTFAEIEKFLDTPVKRYSSGMYVRLAFAVAAHLEPEILLVDEVLAVGDAAFQKKCLGKMGDVAKEGRTVFFVSHNMAAVSSLCSQVNLLERGCLIASGIPSEVIQTYLTADQLIEAKPLFKRTNRRGNGRLHFTQTTFLSGGGTPIEIASSGQDIYIALSYVTEQAIPLRNVAFSIGFYTPLGQFILYCGNEMIGVNFDELPASGTVRCLIPRLPLSPGRYDLNINAEVNGILADWVPQAITLNVEAGDFFGTGKLPPEGHGGLLIPHSWEVC
jgi:lipopolysaccharide transport system ATP-binding protein